MNRTTESIDRLEFLRQLGLTGSALMAFYCAGTLTACSQAATTVTPLSASGVTLDLTATDYAGLTTVGSYTYSGNILIAHIKDGNYIALSKVCPHQGSTVQYVPSADYVYCPDHGSIFTTTGVVTRGPAVQGLTQYKTSLSSDGKILTITN